MKQWNHKKIRIGLNLLLVIALAVTLLAPAANRTLVQPDNPVSEANILPIETVNLGQSAGESLAQRLQSLGTGGQQGLQSQDQEQPDQEQPEQQNPAPARRHHRSAAAARPPASALQSPEQWRRGPGQPGPGGRGRRRGAGGRSGPGADLV